MPSKLGYILPDDWDGASYELWFLCMPCSPQWKGIIKGAVYEASREYNWEGTNVQKEIGSLTAWGVYDSMSNCNDGLLAIAAAIERMTASGSGASVACCNTPEQTGTELEGESADEPTVFGPGEQWPSEEAYLDDKCLVANRLWLDYRNVVEQLDNYNVDSLLAGGVSIAVGIIATILTAGTASVAISAVLGSASGLVTLLAATLGFGFTTLIASLDNNKQALVCALYNASNGQAAKDAWANELDDGSLSAFEIQVMNILNVMQYFNLLFEPTSEVLADPAPSPIDCDTCPEATSIKFQLGIDLLDRGSGSLVDDDASRILASHEDSNNFHYVSFGVYADPTQNSYATDCSPLPAGCSGQPCEQFVLEVNAPLSGPNFLLTKCDSGVWSIVHSGTSLPVGNYTITWFEGVWGVSSWGMDCKLRDHF